MSREPRSLRWQTRSHRSLSTRAPTPPPALPARATTRAGALPGILLAPFKASETKKATGERTTQASPGDHAEALLVGAAPSSDGAAPRAAPLTLLQALRMREFWPKILGTAGGWFLFDITFYGNSLFQPAVLKTVFDVGADDDADDADDGGGGDDLVGADIPRSLCYQMLVVALIGLPGYFIAVCLMDRWGRYAIQLQGFAMMTALYLVLGLAYEPLADLPALLLVLYGLTFFFSNFGPNSTTFILPAETFPPEVRATFNGISAAAGKLGATIGSAAFKPMSVETSVGDTMVACAGVACLGFVLTYFFVEDHRVQNNNRA